MKIINTLLLVFCLFFLNINALEKTNYHRKKHQPIVKELIQLLKEKPELKKPLKTSILKANRLNISTLSDYYNFLDEMVAMVPTERNLLPTMLEFYYLIDNSPSDILRKDYFFQQWVSDFANDWGSYLNTFASAEKLDTFYKDPIYHIEDYDRGPSGWLTYNQFFTRHCKPERRSIDYFYDDDIIASPADSVFKGQWKIDDKSEIIVKGIKWSIKELLKESPYADSFKEGTYIHMFLNVNDYHRYHVPVRGEVKDLRNIHGKVILDVIKNEDGSLSAVDGDTYQFSQERGLIVLDSPIGLVAVLPIGMAQVSSVNLTAEENTTLLKGEEFGYFAFGGSDIIVIFEKDKVEITAEEGVHYNQGKMIAKKISK